MANIFHKSDYRISGSKLLKELLKIRPNQCECCKLTRWLNQPIKLEVHHIDGDNTNNNLENLQLLCPNCHSYTDSWCKNKSKAIVTDEQLIEALKNSISIHQALLKVGLSTAGINYEKAKNLIIKHGISLAIPESGKYTKSLEIYYCPDCGKQVSVEGVRCPECAHKRMRKIERPSRDELKQRIRIESFLAIARSYNNEISDNAIRKWCDTYNLPRTKKEINSYTDEEWNLI